MVRPHFPAAIATLLVLASLGGTPLSQEQKTPATQPAPFDPTTDYSPRTLRGWRILVNAKLLSNKDLSEAVLEELDHQLYHITRKVPSTAVEKLRAIPFWVELKDRDVYGMCYHPSQRWLIDHHFNPDKAQAVELGNAQNFLDWSKHQPCMALHELAHAYHHKILGYDNPEILQTFRHAVDSKSYEQVLNYRNKLVRHYALSNVQEYFAESTEAFFGTNDFYPFVRPELQQHDPTMAALLAKLWATK